MKKLFVFVLVAVLALTLVACGTGKEPSGGETKEQEKTSSEVSGNETSDVSKPTEIELFGYKYSFSETPVGNTSTYGHVANCSNYSIFLFKGDTISYTSEDNIVEDSKDKLFSSVYSSLRYYPEKQNVAEQKKTTSKYNEEVFLVNGSFESGDGNKDYYACYFVTEEGKVRFCIGLCDGSNNSSIKQAIELIADNLQKA